MTNQDSDEITNYELFQRLVKLSDAIQRIADTQHEHGKTLDQLSSTASDINDNVARIVEHLPDD